ncbi:MAG: hypothetical protein ALECFALPRED_003415 [Alectoria fallacina]|uniref:Uncharacterized protein n=1 Tax=Alectoria fallacina TaxID=1903189 RepID=A0A8H3FKN8_9LECA|nr:MAG: hypothetical protein ALECFALPRED_003415 [Alectoria fallacina]
MLNFNAFKEELHATLDSVLDQAETLQATAEDPVELDRAWILNKMNDQMAQNIYVLEPGAMQIALGLGHLHKLPRELRDLVYGYAIVDGNVAIVRASKQTNKEASELVFQKGIYRLALGFSNRIINPPLGHSLAENIQNLNIRVNARNFFIDGLDKYLPILHQFDGSTIQRKNCVMTIECCPFFSGIDASQVVRALEDLTGFERVILELDLEWGGEAWSDTMYDIQKDQIWGRIDRAFLHFQELLEPTLGTGHYGFDTEGQRLAFHPRT